MTNVLNHIDIYTDGSTAPTNPGFSGWGYFALDSLNNHYNGYGPVGINSTNNEAELVALTKALSYFTNIKEDISLHFHLDSNYVLDGVNDLTRRSKENFTTRKGKPLANRAYWIQLHELITKIKTKKITIKFIKVKAHSDNLGNRQADKNATLGRVGLMQDPNVVDKTIIELAKELAMESKKIPLEQIFKNFNPWITGKKLFFKTNTSSQLKNGYYFYTSLTYEKDPKHKDKYLGKSDANSHYSILLTKKTIDVLTNFHYLFNKTFTHTVVPVLLDIPLIKKKNIFSRLLSHFNDVVTIKGNLAINYDSEVLGEVFNPPKLVFRIETFFNHGLTLLDDYLHNKKLTYFDITENIFFTKKKGQVLNLSFKSDTRMIIIPDMVINNKLTTVKINVGIDIPTRNNLLAIVKESNITKVYLVVFDITEHSYRIGVFFDNEENVLLSYTIDSNFRLYVR